MPLQRITAAEVLLADLLETIPGQLALIVAVERDRATQTVRISFETGQPVSLPFDAHVHVDQRAHTATLAS